MHSIHGRLAMLNSQGRLMIHVAEAMIAGILKQDQ